MFSENPNPTQTEPQPDDETQDPIVIELTTQLATARAEIEALKRQLRRARNLAAIEAQPDAYATSRRRK